MIIRKLKDFKVGIFINCLLLIFSACQLNAQDDKEYVQNTFNDTRIINSSTTKTVPKKSLDFRIGHRFGDIAGSAGGVQSFFGLEDAANVRIAFEYGITDQLTVALARNKGSGRIVQLWEGHAKYRLLSQTKNNSMPISVAVLTNSVLSGMPASSDPESASAFTKDIHRVSYFSQFIIARKFGEQFSLQVMPSWLHRNFVAFEDENDLFTIGVGGRLRLTKILGLLVEYHHTFSEYRSINKDIFFDPLLFALEINTGGHVFQLSFTNSTGIIENDFIPYTQSSWQDGEFRYGFTISRVFRLG